MGSHLNERSPANKPLPNLGPMRSPEDWLEGGNLAFQKKCCNDGQDRQESYQKGSSTKNVVRSGGKRNEQLEKNVWYQVLHGLVSQTFQTAKKWYAI